MQPELKIFVEKQTVVAKEEDGQIGVRRGHRKGLELVELAG